MGDARARERWKHTSAMLAAIANTVRDPKKKKHPYQPSDFDPYAKGKGSKDQIVVTNMGDLKDAFETGKGL